MQTTNETKVPAEAVTESEAAISFNRLPGETTKAYAAFRIFLKLGSERSVRKAARKRNKGVTVVAEWSSKYQWTERAAAFDEHVARIEQAAMDKQAQADAQKWADRLNAHRERRFHIGTLMLDTAEKLLKGRKRPDPAAADRLAKVGDMLIGLSTGAPTSNISVGSSPDAEAIPIVASVGTVNVWLPEKKPLPDEAEFQAHQSEQNKNGTVTP